MIRVPEGQQPSSQSDLVSTPFNLIMNDACMTYDTGLTTLFPASCAVPYSPRASKRQANLTDVALRQLFLLGPVSGGSNIQLANKPGSCVVVGANGVTGTLGSCSSATATWNTAVSGLDGSPATPTPTATPQPGTGSGGISSGAIAGIVVGVILGLAIIGILVYYFTRKSRSDKDNEAGEVAGDKKPMNISMPYEGSANTPVGLSPMSGVSYNAVPNDPSANPSSLASFASLPAIPTSDLGITAPAALAEPENAVPERLTTLKRGASLAPNSATVASYSVPPAIPTGPLPTVAESPTSPFGSAAPGSPASVGSTAAAPVVLHTGAVVSATKGYIPREADEIEVRPKDSITIEAVYEDGWCKGLNSRTGLRGVIPSACFE